VFTPCVRALPPHPQENKDLKEAVEDKTRELEEELRKFEAEMKKFHGQVRALVACCAFAAAAALAFASSVAYLGLPSVFVLPGTQSQLTSMGSFLTSC
jgi:hypothetical protein